MADLPVGTGRHPVHAVFEAADHRTDLRAELLRASTPS
jgi:hypothetical protein